jgi:hypothetical protein
VVEALRRIAKFLYWKLCFPQTIKLIPPVLQVMSGPFQGIRYTMRAQGSSLSPKIVGTYEKELYDVIRSIQTDAFDTVVDIGAAEGYYAVGLAVTSPVRRIVAFEAEERGRSLLGEMASRNSVRARIDIRGRCELDDLTSVFSSSGKTVLFCDVEGYEATLLDPILIDQLRGISILVELHEFVQRGISGIIRERFASSHSISEILSTDRTWADFPQPGWLCRHLPRTLALRAMNEARPETMAWFWMVPNAN